MTTQIPSPTGTTYIENVQQQYALHNICEALLVSIRHTSASQGSLKFRILSGQYFLLSYLLFERHRIELVVT